MILFFIYISFISLLSFSIMYTDKLHSKFKLWRFPENLIFTMAILGGSLGTYIGMYIFKHKTKKKNFTIGIPIIIIIQVLLLFKFIPFITSLNAISIFKI